MTGKGKLIENKNEKYTLTSVGLIQAMISRHTQIASPTVTLKLQEAMDQVGQLKIPMMTVPNTMAQIVNHDTQVILNNQVTLASSPQLQKAKQEWAKAQKAMNVPKVTGNWQGQEVAIKTKRGDHDFAESELTQLFADKTITIDTKRGQVSGKPYSVKGKLKNYVYKGKRHFGFKAAFNKKK